MTAAMQIADDALTYLFVPRPVPFPRCCRLARGNTASRAWTPCLRWASTPTRF